MTAANNTETTANIYFEINWDNSPKATETLRRHYEAAEDYQAVREALVVGALSVTLCAETWIDSAIEDTPIVYDEHEYDGAEYTNNREKCVALYEQWITQDLEEDAVTLNGYIGANNGILMQTSTQDHRHIADGGNPESWKTLNMGYIGERWFVWKNSGDGDDSVIYAGDDKEEALAKYKEEQASFLSDESTDDGQIPGHLTVRFEDDAE